ncbi:MAG: hypothetical protein JRF40_11155 [Deltaproteobacteria bacterium]|nr:hypothetical protein [Deltaproteobacteria bacterium]
MECPHCESIDNKVIDSRLTRERFSIRRRRECLTCSERFTTYESTEERLLPVLIRKKAGMGATKAKLKTMLSFLSDTLKTLSGETENLIAKVDKLDKAYAVEESKRKTVARMASKKKASVKKPAVRKTTPMSATDVVIKVIKRHKKGVGISKLKDKTGFDDKKVRGIVYRASKQGKIKRVGKGIYVKP